MFSGRKRSPRENPPKGDFSPRQAKIRQTVAENATHGMSRTFVWRGRKVAMRKHEKVTIWRVFAWRPFAFSPLFVVSLPGGAKGRYTKTRQMVILAGFRVATFFAPPGKDTTNRRQKGNACKVLYFRVARRKVAMQKHEKVTIWRVFAWRLFAPKTR